MRRVFPIAFVVVCSLVRCDSGAIQDDDGPDEKPIARTLYATDRIEAAFSIAESTDGNIYVSGYGEGIVGPLDGIHSKPLILRIQPDGDIADTLIAGDFRDGYVIGMQPVGDDFIALINSRVVSDGQSLQNRNLSLYQLDGAGRISTLLRDFGGADSRGVIQTENSGIAAIMEVYDPTEGELVKLALDGSIIWTYRMPGVEAVSRAVQGPTGDFFALGELGGDRIQMSRISPDGSQLWNRTYEHVSDRRHSYKIAVGQNRIVLIGWSATPDYVQHIFVSSYSLNGDLIWEQQYSTGKYLSTDAIVVLPNNDIAFAWSLTQESDYMTLCEVVRLSGDGDIVWRKPFEVEYVVAEVTDMIVTNDNRLVILGEVGRTIWSEESDIVVWQLGI